MAKKTLDQLLKSYSPRHSGRLRTLVSRELGRPFSAWVPYKPGESKVLNFIRKWALGRLKAVWIIVLFPLMAAVVGKSVLKGNNLGVESVSSVSALLVVLTVVGFGSIGLTTAGVSDEWKVLARESSWGVRGWQHILSKFLGSVPPTIVLGVLTAWFFCLLVETDTTMVHENNFAFLAIMLVLYSWCCTAMGLAVSSVVRGTKSTVLVLMATLAMFVVLSEIPIPLDNLEGWAGDVLKLISLVIPARWAGGAWAAQIDLESLNPYDEHGFTWEPTFETALIDCSGLLICMVAYLVIASIMVRSRAPKILLNQ
ncbi:MAG: ABC transporter permease [Propionibacteriaceae bacterium]|jgi:hypothetical protein|nr:ABC transporter permease [Propionibacteriaceae bacterium]